MTTDSLSMDSAKCAIQSMENPNCGTSTVVFIELIAIVSFIALLMIIVGVCLYRRSDRYKLKKKMKAKNKEVNFDGMIESAFQAKPLYDQLKGKIHPDKFATEPEKMQIATELFTSLQRNKGNYEELLRIKERAINELDITL